MPYLWSPFSQDEYFAFAWPLVSHLCSCAVVSLVCSGVRGWLIEWKKQPWGCWFHFTALYKKKKNAAVSWEPMLIEHLCVNSVVTVCHFRGCAPLVWQRDYSKHGSCSAEIASSCHCHFCSGHRRAHCLFWHHLVVFCKAGPVVVDNKGLK